ncbi:MAG: hypothetical protein Q8S22_05565, partial [Eubacteriales bacterium]|nr:hypothetical protein [Eubacteriales bacterium]
IPHTPRLKNAHRRKIYISTAYLSGIGAYFHAFHSMFTRKVSIWFATSQKSCRLVRTVIDSAHLCG